MKDIFCANCQAVTPHQGSVDSNGEFVFTCNTDGCGRFIKFPVDTKPENFGALIEEQEEVNRGQVSVEEQEKKLNELLNADISSDTQIQDTQSQDQTIQTDTPSDSVPQDTTDQSTQ